MPEDSVLLGNLAEEFSERVRQGELPDLDAYARRHPALAERIRALFPTLMLLEGMAAGRERTTTPLVIHGTGVLVPGSVFGGYRIEREVGRGGMGIVYDAFHLALGRRVALKVLPLWGGQPSPHLERFLREARTAAGLHHTNIVPVFDVGQVSGLPYYAMQLIAGTGLDQAGPRRGREGPSWYRWVAGLGVQAAEGLGHAHQRGVIHRDVKPSNLLVDDQGVVWITDFGLARAAGDVSLTASGAVVGTPRYMSPEQAETARRRIDHRTDIYSLGVTLYEVLTRRPAFEGHTPQEVISQIVSREPPSPRQLDPAVPRDLETIVLKAMAKRPEDRYSTAVELADDLRRFLGGEPVRARRISSAGRLVRWARRNRAAAALLLVSAVAVLALVGLFVSKVYQARLAEAFAEAEWARVKEARQRARAEQALDTAVTAERAEAQARLQERLALERAEASEYFHRILLASNAWKDGDIRRAKQLLDQTAPARRGWEWYYLSRLCNESRLTPECTVLKCPDGVRCLAYRPDGRELAAAGGDGKSAIVLWDPATGRLSRTLSGHAGGVMALAYSPDGKRLASGGLDRKVRVWDVVRGAEVFRLSLGEAYAARLAYSPDGKLLAVATSGGRIKVMDAATGRQVRTFRDDWTEVKGLAFSPDGRRLACGDIGIKVWDVDDGRVVVTLRGGHTLPVSGLAFTPDGRRLVSCSLDRTVKLWDLGTGREVFALRGHSSCVNGVAVSPDGSRLASAGEDGTVKLWDVETGKEALTLHGPGGPLSALRFSPDGRALATGGSQGSVRLWQAPLPREPAPAKP
jgi:hypothetical protein